MIDSLELFPDSHAAGAEPDTRELPPTEPNTPEQRPPLTPLLPDEVRARLLNRPPPV